MTAEHQQLLDLASRVPEHQVPIAKRMLEALIVDPLWLALASAPLDDEELTPEAAAAILEAEQGVGHRESTPHEEILREFGLK
jgi:hypothetical protein